MHLFHHLLSVFVYMTMGKISNVNFSTHLFLIVVFVFWLKSGVQSEVIDVAISYYFVKWCFIVLKMICGT